MIYQANITDSGPALSIIVPVYNERESMPLLLAELAHWRQRGAEVLLVDGGSQDGCDLEAEQEGWRLIRSAKGRANQMNAGAAASSGEVLLFLHADTKLPPQADQLILNVIDQGADWGRFDVRIIGDSLMLPVVARLMNLRSRLSAIATGDQGIFIRRETFQQVDGFPQQRLMEDIEISARLRRISTPACLKQKVETSGRRWDQNGALKTILLMWRLRWAYWRGSHPDRLAELYR